MDLIVKTLDEMKKNISCMCSESCYQYSDGWRDGYEAAVDQVKRIIQQDN